MLIGRLIRHQPSRIRLIASFLCRGTFGVQKVHRYKSAIEFNLYGQQAANRTAINSSQEGHAPQ